MAQRKELKAYACPVCDEPHRRRRDAAECCEIYIDEVNAWECDCGEINSDESTQCHSCRSKRGGVVTLGKEGPGECECCGSTAVRIWRSPTRVNDTWGCLDCGAFLGMVFGPASEEARNFISAYPTMQIVR